MKLIFEFVLEEGAAVLDDVPTVVFSCSHPPTRCVCRGGRDGEQRARDCCQVQENIMLLGKELDVLE